MALHQQLRDLLHKNYARINDLNRHIKRRDLEEALGQNCFKSKVKARNVITSLHQLLDAFYKYLLKSIDESVNNISDTLKQHFSEIEESVTYSAQLCLIAEKFLKEDSGNEAEGILIKEKLEESLNDGDDLNSVDYKAFVSLDLDVDMNALFAVPFIHIVSHNSDQSEVTKLHSLSFEGMRQQVCDAAQSKEPMMSNPPAPRDLTPAPMSSLTGPTVGNMPIKKEALTVSIPGHGFEEKVIKRSLTDSNIAIPEAMTGQIFSDAKQEENSQSASVDSVNGQEIPPKTNKTVSVGGNAVAWLDKQRKDQFILPVINVTQPSPPGKQGNVDLVGSQQDGTFNYPRQETISGSSDGMCESGCESLHLLSPGQVQELPQLTVGSVSNDTLHDKQLLSNESAHMNLLLNKIHARLSENSESASLPVSNSAFLSVPNGINVNESTYSATPPNTPTCLSSSSTQNIADRNLMILQSCFKNAQKQSWQMQSFPYRNA